jgi:hypothetical protein
MVLAPAPLHIANGAELVVLFDLKAEATPGIEPG